MKFTVRTVPALLLAFILGISAACAAEETPAVIQAPAIQSTAEATETAQDATPAPMGPIAAVYEPLSARAKSFTFLKPARDALIKYYTAVRLYGIEPAVYVFTDKEGVTQFRVYGRAPDAKRGFYVAAVTATVSDGAAGWDFTLDVPDAEPVKDARVFALYKGKNLPKEEVPVGLRKGQGAGRYFFFNIFGKREYVFWASPDGENYAWYLPNGSRPLAGSPMLDADAFAERMHSDDDAYYRIPEELNGGYAKEVMITTTDGKTAIVSTNLPAIVMDDLKTR